jgi:hypothetical protein
MPKRKTADVTAEGPAAAEPRKKSSAAKPKTAAAATHKRASAPKSTKTAESPAAYNPVVPTSVPAMRRMPTHEEIAARAYSFWEARGFQGGSPQDDWFRAERELLEAE